MSSSLHLGPQSFPRSWSYVPHIAAASDTSNIPQDDVGNSFGLYVTCSLEFFLCCTPDSRGHDPKRMRRFFPEPPGRRPRDRSSGPAFGSARSMRKIFKYFRVQAPQLQCLGSVVPQSGLQRLVWDTWLNFYMVKRRKRALSERLRRPDQGTADWTGAQTHT